MDERGVGEGRVGRGEVERMEGAGISRDGTRERRGLLKILKLIFTAVWRTDRGG